MTWNPVRQLLAAAGLLLAVIAAQLISYGEDPVPAEPVPAGQKQLPFLPESAIQSLSAMEQTVARPLFRPDRRQPEVFAPMQDMWEEPMPPVLQDVEIPYTLSAVVITKEQAVAYLIDPNADLTRVVQGDMIGDWKLAEVRPDAVVLERSGQRSELVLRPDDTKQNGDLGAEPFHGGLVSEQVVDDAGLESMEPNVIPGDGSAAPVGEAPWVPQEVPSLGRTKRGPRPSAPEVLHNE